MRFSDLEHYSNALIHVPKKTNGYDSAAYDQEGIIIQNAVFAEGNWRYSSAPPCVLRKRETFNFNLQRARHLFLGILSPHFGHFLLETIPQCHFFFTDQFKKEIENRIDKFIFFSGATRRELMEKQFIQDFFHACDISWKDIEIANTSFTCQHLFVPKKVIKAKNDFGPSRILDEAARKPFSALAKIFGEGSDNQKKVFFTRRKFQKGQGARRVGNEKEVEDVFISLGFEIVSPEKLLFREQVKLASSSKWLAGFEGSAMHLSAFQQNNANTITINKRDCIHNQDFFNEVSGVSGITILRKELELGKEKRRVIFSNTFPFIRKAKRGVIIDSNALKNKLTEILESSA